MRRIRRRGARRRALDAVYKICEELNGRLDVPVPGIAEGSPAGMLIPRLLTLMAHPEASVRRAALGSVNLMVPSWPESHWDAMDTYLRGLFTLAHDGDNGVRKHVCSGIVSLLYRAPDKLTPNMREVITYMIDRTNDGDEDVALGRASSGPRSARRISSATPWRCFGSSPPNLFPCCSPTWRTRRMTRR